MLLSDIDICDKADCGTPRISESKAEPGVDGGVGPTIPNPDVGSAGLIGGNAPCLPRLLALERTAERCPKSPRGILSLKPRCDKGVLDPILDAPPEDLTLCPGVAKDLEIFDIGVAVTLPLLLLLPPELLLPWPLVLLPFVNPSVLFLPGLFCGESRSRKPGELGLPRSELGDGAFALS